ncbi:MAG: tRNA (adenosine(37)-N6)-threonylcarbamoyltransferase complex transferase subunit TsaD [Candidatus Diapherotrites archaeon]|nr:tRNA (adenosine(37)-N6)-threonylcarbamoyltransferase complex transferase subunit TsaD [Candidatus Diapherotrites archaeon]
MIALGIESTAHTFGIGIVDSECNILANEKHSVATEAGGLIPRELAEHHLKHAKPLLESALEKARVKIKEIDLISFSQGPGIGNALSIGAVAARALALGNKKPLLGVNHCVAHVEIAKKLTNAKDAIYVYASGANTQIIGYETGRYRVYGETLDIGIGNLLDSFGRALGIGFPAGPKIDEMYFQAKEYVELPYSVKGMDLVFSGLQTAAERLVGKADEKDLAYSLMHNAFAELTEVSERALAHTEKGELVVTGGVAASKALRKMLQEMCEARGAFFRVPPFPACPDSGLLPAWLGVVEYESGIRMKLEETIVKPKQRTDDVEVTWLSKK